MNLVPVQAQYLSYKKSWFKTHYFLDGVSISAADFAAKLSNYPLSNKLYRKSILYKRLTYTMRIKSMVGLGIIVSHLKDESAFNPNNPIAFTKTVAYTMMYTLLEWFMKYNKDQRYYYLDRAIAVFNCNQNMN